MSIWLNKNSYSIGKKEQAIRAINALLFTVLNKGQSSSLVIICFLLL